MTLYAGPLRDEPLSLELHNTLYASADGPADGLADARGAASFLAAVASRLPVGGAGRPPGVVEMRRLRTVIRAAIGATIAGTAPDPSVIASLNRLAAAAPLALQLALSPQPALRIAHPGASRREVVVAAFAADAIALLAGPAREQLRACGAPGCVLVYLQSDPRRRWCSDGCGNRARQARHYRRTRGRP